MELLYNIKKRIIANYKKYLTIEGQYTCILPDKIYLKKVYQKRFGVKPNFRKPKTFSEKLNWLKLYDRRPEYTMMVDKYAVRQYIADTIGEEYLVPLIGVWDSIEDIDFDSLPNQFVLKCNHDNGVIICKDKSTFDVEEAKKQLAFHLNRDYYKKLREWPYKNVPRKIICEKYMENKDKSQMLEYQIFCFDGEPKMIRVISNRFSGEPMVLSHYDIDWNYLPYSVNGTLFDNIYSKPAFLNKLIELSKKLSINTKLVRVDINYWNESLFFGELTFSDSGGFSKYTPSESDLEIASWIEILKKKRI